MSIFKHTYTQLLVWLLLGSATPALAQFPANIGKLPPGKTITICYEVTVDNDTPPNTTEVCEQGVVTYTNPNNVQATLNLKTDDPNNPSSNVDPTCTEVQVCEISMITAGNRMCEQGSTTYSQEITVTYAGGAGNLEIDANGMMYSFPLGTSPQTVTLTGLPIDGNPVTVMASFAGVNNCMLTVQDLFTAPTLLTVDAGMDQDICLGDMADLMASAMGGTPPYSFSWSPGGQMTDMITVTPNMTTTYTVTVTDDIGCVAEDMVTVNVTGISAVVAAAQSACDPFTNTYSQTLEVTHTGAPNTGMLSVNGQLFPIQASPQTVVLTGLVADEMPVNVTAFFTDKPQCVFEEMAVFTAPKDCSVRCDITDVQAGPAHDCDEQADTYQQDMLVYYQGTNLTGFLLVEIDGDGNFIPFPIENTSPQTLTLTLPLDGQEHDIFVKFSDETGCTFRAERLFRALHMCGCDIVGMDIMSGPTCDGNGNYDICFFFEGFNLPQANGQMLQINGQNVQFTYELVPGGAKVCTSLPANGERGVDVFFKAENNCTWTARDAYDAPRCDPNDCAITALTVLNATCTDPVPAYDLQLQIEYQNPPAGGTLDVTVDGVMQSFPITGSPQVVNFFGLPPTGAPVTVEAKFSDDRDCKLRVEGLYDAPDCGIVCMVQDIALDGEPVCVEDRGNTTYKLNLNVSYMNPPASGSLRISINGTHHDFPITGSPQMVMVEGLVPTGLPTDVTASFTANPNCMRTEVDMFTAPDCNVAQPCDLFDIQLADRPQCQPDDTYSACFMLTGLRMPLTPDPNLMVIIGGEMAQVSSYQSSQNGSSLLICVQGLRADGRSKDVFIKVADQCTKFVSRLYTAPVCGNPDEDPDDRCDITSLTSLGTQCDGNGTYGLSLQLRYNDPPASGQIAVEINGQWTYHPITGSPQTIVVNNLPANGQNARVFAKFTAVSGCTIYERNLYRAPANCRNNRMDPAGSTLGFDIAIFPNPSSGQFNILATSKTFNKLEVTVYNGLGQRVKSIQIEENQSSILDLSDQPEGVYTLRMQADDYVKIRKVQLVK